jgi:DNA-binding MarR family transcriptional regulator
MPFDMNNRQLPGKTLSQEDNTEQDMVDLGSLGRRLGYILRRAQIAVFADFFEAFAEHGIKPAQYSVLTVIGSNPGLTQTQVAETLGIKKPNFVAMIKTLETRGLAIRTATRGDKRSNALFLTTAGKALLKNLDIIADHHENRLRDRMGDEDYDALYQPLWKLAQLD